MNCLSIEITNVSPSLRVEVKRLGGIEISASRYDVPLIFEISDVYKNNHLKPSCGIVCSVGDIHYIRVSPNEEQWIAPYEEIVYTVESDTNWNILIN